MAVRTLYATGYLHNHARMWLAGTGSHKPYLLNADNVARYAPEPWHTAGSVIDTSYETLDQQARQPLPHVRGKHTARLDSLELSEPLLTAEPPKALGLTAPNSAAAAGRDVWLVHPWSLGEMPDALPADTLVVGVFAAEFHRAWPWSERRWNFVCSRLAELATERWYADAATIGAALQTARSVNSIHEPHFVPWLASWAECSLAPQLFPAVDSRCDSFSRWWTRATDGGFTTIRRLVM